MNWQRISVTYSNCQFERTYHHWFCGNKLTHLVHCCWSPFLYPHIYYVLFRTFVKGNYMPLETRFFIEKPTKERWNQKSETFPMHDSVWIVKGEGEGNSYITSMDDTRRRYMLMEKRRKHWLYWRTERHFHKTSGEELCITTDRWTGKSTKLTHTTWIVI